VSKFDAIRNAKRTDSDVLEPLSAPKPTLPSPALSEVPAPKKRGRPPGKRSSADHDQVTAYIRHDTRLKVKSALIQEGEQQDFSELIESLLTQWLKSRI
jgi:hypothetical protein